MVQKKSHEVDAWLGKPDPKAKIVLIYGPDRGMVSERARKFANRTGLALDDPFAVLKLDAAELASDASRLIDEARTISMFGGERLIWLRNAANDKALNDALAVLCEEPPVDAVILIEAVDLKKSSALRRTVEQNGSAMALPCYADNTRAVDGLIDDELSKAGLAIDLEARQLLKNSLGGDRLASRGEIEKLALYCHGTGHVGVDDVVASVGDVSALSHDAVTDSVLVGNTSDYDLAFARLVASGVNPFLPLLSMIRQFQLLQQLRHKLDSGNGNVASIIASSRPPVFFARRKTIENALGRWSSSQISRALERLQSAVLQTRKNTALAADISRQTLLSLCLESARATRRH